MRIVMRARHEQRVSGALRLEVDATQQFREELAVEIGENHAERTGLAAAQRARGAVGCEAQLARDLEHAGTRVIAHRRTRVEYARHRGDGHLRQARNVLDRHRHPMPPGQDVACDSLSGVAAP